MIIEHNIGEILGSILSSKVSFGIKRALFNTISRSSSIPASASASTIVFPVIVTDDISKDIAMEISKSAEVKIAYDVKRILERDLMDSPQDTKYESIVGMLPFDRQGAVDISTLTSLKDNVDVEFELKKEAMDYVQNKIKDVNIKLYSEAKSFIIKERGSQPTSIDIEIKYITGKGKGDIKTITYNIGVSAVPRYVEEETLRLKLSTYDNRRFFKKYISLTNSEKHFVKDFLLDYKVMREMAKERTKTSSVFKDIEKARLQKDMGLNKYPFAVFLISKDCVEKLNDSEKMDIYSESKVIMKKLMAMGLYIYNSDTDIIEIKYDGDKKFTSYPFDEVAKDTSRYEKELKQLVRLNK